MTTGSATFTFSPELSADLRLALGDSALAAATNAINKFYASTPTGAATEAVSKGVDAAVASYKEKNGKDVDPAMKDKLREEITQELKKKPAVAK